jgi:uncharacterized RDD family membrane protein YckC
MGSERGRLAQIFIWREASAPDIEYARQLLSAVNPDAARLLATDNPPVKLFSIFGPWPDDPWGPALRDMRASPAPDGSQWIDTKSYDLAGWQGTDSRTGDHVFVVTAYRKANAPAAQTFQGGPAPAPSYSPPTASIPQVPYYPQYPTGPIAWPPVESTAASNQPSGRQSGGPVSSAMPYYGRGSQATNEPAGGRPPAEPSGESYAPYYAGFQLRLVAGLIDLFLVAILAAGALYLYNLQLGGANPQNFGDWIATYWPYFCIAVLIFAVYHIAQWSIWGKTLGKQVMGIKVVGRNGKKPQFGRAVLRMVGYFPSLLLGGVGIIASDARRQALHDKIAETYVVPVRPPTPVPAGLPGYPTVPATAAGGLAATSGQVTAPTLGMATLAGAQSYEEVQLKAEQAAQGSGRQPEEKGVFREIASLDSTIQTGGLLPEYAEQGGREAEVTARDMDVLRGPLAAPNLPVSEATGALNEQMLRQRAGSTAGMERARELFRQGMEQMEVGVVESERAYWIEPAMARRAAAAFQAAAEIVPSSVAYRYFFGVALRYSEGFEIAIREFRRVLDLDPSHYEARQQVAYGQRWHDVFVYPPWSARPIVMPGTPLPEPVAALLPPNNQPVTRLVLLREGNTKVVSVLSRTPRGSWARPLTADLSAHTHVLLSRTPSGPIIAFYVVVEDRPGDPYKGETFLNPHDPGSPTYDACQLGQNLLSQLHRQDHTYLIFVDEENKVLLSRRLDFDPQTQVNINQCLYEVQTLPSQIMDPQRFQAAAEWHMEHFSLDQVQ